MGGAFYHHIIFFFHHIILKQKRTSVGKGLLVPWSDSLKSTSKWYWRRRWGCSQMTAWYVSQGLWREWSYCPGCQWWIRHWGNGMQWYKRKDAGCLSTVLWHYGPPVAPQSEHWKERVKAGTHIYDSNPRAGETLFVDQRPDLIFHVTTDRVISTIPEIISPDSAKGILCWPERAVGSSGRPVKTETWSQALGMTPWVPEFLRQHGIRECHEGEKVGSGLFRGLVWAPLNSTAGSGWSQAHKGHLEYLQEGPPKLRPSGAQDPRQEPGNRVLL